jgi:hypothetical protein
MGYGVYPNSTPEFRILEKLDGTTEMQVRYINNQVNYIGKWMPIKIEKETGTELNPNS